MADHLLLPEPRRLPSRRASGGGGGGPSRNRPMHGRQLRTELNEVIARPRSVEGIDPNRVFKMRAVSRPQDSAFEGRRLEVLGETGDYTYFVLSDDEGGALDDALIHYTASGQNRSFFDVINAIEPYDAEDRRGPGLDSIPETQERATVDVTVWPSGDHQEAVRRAEIVERIVTRRQGRILLRSVSARRTYLRVDVSRGGLTDLLETSVVERVRTPPVPFLDFQDWWNVTVDDLDLQRSPGGVVGVIDDAPAEGHPMLAGLVLSSESVSPETYQWQARGAHGTEVVGRVLYPGLDTNLRDATPMVAVGTVRVMRILEPDPAGFNDAPRFATFALPHEIVERSVRHLHESYGIRVFNLSVGYSEPFSQVHVEPITEIIDELSRELDVVIVVPTGNAAVHVDGTTVSGHHVLRDKPRYMLSPEQRLAEPGPAALALTVGAIALSGAPAELPNRFGWQAISEPDELSPFSRTGPGVGTTERRQNKPDVVQYGGNVVLNDSGYVVSNDPGASLVAPSTRGAGDRLMAAVNGTSYAAPLVARVAADIAERYPEGSANLIRALLVSGSRLPEPAHRIAASSDRARSYGHGVPSLSRSTESGGATATMIHDGEMNIDTVQIHPLPVPDVFRRGSGERTISVALAFDPPVRRQRREYIAASMKVDVYRDIDPDDLAEILQKQDIDDPNDMINDRRRLKLMPGSSSFNNATLMYRSWTARRDFINDDETFYVVLTHRAQTWARNDPNYVTQRYGLAVSLERRALTNVDLRAALLNQVRVPARVRLRS